MVLTPMQTSEASSDEEVLLLDAAEQAVTTAPGSWRRRIGLSGLALAACAAALMLLPARESSVQMAQPPHRLAELIKLHALDHHGVRLSDSAVVATVTRARAKPGRAGRWARRLSEKVPDEEDVVQLLEGEGLSDACSGALVEMEEGLMTAFGELLANSMMECLGAAFFDMEGCEEGETEATFDEFFNSMTTDCTASGDSCDVTFTNPEVAEATPETEKECVPKECHDEAKDAVKYMIEEPQKLEADAGDDLPAAGDEILNDVSEAFQIDCGKA